MVEGLQPLSSRREFAVGDKYWIHAHDGIDYIVDGSPRWERQSVLVTVKEIGDGFVVEECETQTFRYEEAGGEIYGFRCYPPKGSPGWEFVPTPSDHWATYRRRREMPKT